MEHVLVGVIGIVVLLFLLALGVHIGVALGLVGAAGLVIILGIEATVSTVVSGAFHFATNPEFIVIPTFTLMGLAAMYGGVSEATFSALNKLTAKLPGGLGIAAILGCAGFGTVCGSSVVAATVFAKVGCPEMRRHGYDKRFSYGLVATAGMIGMLIPPSMLAVIYGLITEESIGQLLIAGIGPGLLLMVIYSLGTVLMVKFRPQLAPRVSTNYSWKERLLSFKGLWPITISAVVVIGGIYGGVFTPTEAAAWGALIILIISFTWGRMRWKQLWSTLGELMGVMAMIFFVITAAKVFGRFMAVSGVAQDLVTVIINLDPSVWQLMLGIMVLFVILGCFLDSTSMIVLTMPLIYPMVKEMGIEPMWFAMVCILSIEAGLVTPPVGLNVYGVKSVAEPDVSTEDIFIGAVPFLIMTLIALGLVIVFPAIATWLPQHIVT
jgi:tripartite ATP-independent transporter DctM subunit